ncbi:transketolase [Gulosibacter chungangensis]|uniref:Transketolase n=1 Tax=Gulosibacter chungangensis TaxID=979746 RepID=A0A7J5B7C5_9MICO|nr:transketolase [Gulosibacter chungangensis]KAB1640565.1 transketolase [Gulosibacter chungangensis]
MASTTHPETPTTPAPSQPDYETQDLAAIEAHLKDRAQFIRTETVRLIEIAKTGHYSSVFSAAEIFAALYYDVMNLYPEEPNHPDRDRFTIGKGHAAVGMYPILADLGYFPMSDLDNYAHLGSAFGDHPDMTKIPGIDFSSGSIGHALSNGIGMALAGRMAGRNFTVFTMIGDGELQEGQVWEAALFAAHHKLDRIVTIIDRNGYQLDGNVDEVMGVEPIAEKWRSFGWRVLEVDGHDVMAVREMLIECHDREPDGIPTCIIAKTLKGKGVQHMEEEPGWHLGYLTPADAERAVREILNDNGDNK